MGYWHSGSSVSKGPFEGCGGHWASSGSGSDALTWRKEVGDKGEKEEEMIGPSNVVTGEKGVQDTVAKKKTFSPGLSGLENAVDVSEKTRGKRGAKGNKKGSYRRRNRVQQVKGDGSKGVELLKKRGLEEVLLEVDGVKKVKVAGMVEMDQGDLILTAGPADRSCGAQ